MVILVAFMGAVGFLLPLSATDLGAGPGLLGLITGLSSLGSLLAAVPGGLLVQRTGTRKPLLAACFLAAASVAGVALSYSLPSILLCVSVYRVAEVVVFVSFQAHVAGMGRDGSDATRWFGWYGFAASLGQLSGPTVAGFLLESGGHRLSWAVVAASFLAAAALSAVLVSPPAAGRDAGVPTRGGLRAMLGGGRWRSILNPAALVAIAASFLVIFAGGSRGTYFPVYLASLGYLPSAIGALVAVGSLAGLASRLVLSWTVRTLGGVFPAMLVSFAVMTVGMAWTPFCRSLPALAVNSFLVGIGGGVAIPLSMATVAQGAPEGMRAVAMGVRLTGNRLATLVNPLVFGLVATFWGIPGAFLVAAGILLAGTAAMGAWWRRNP